MAFKYTMIFAVQTGGNQAVGTRVGGFTESLYNGGNILPTDTGLLNSLMIARAGLFPNTTAIVGVRIADTSVRNKSQVIKLNIPGTWGATQDQPKVCVVVEGRGSIGQVLKLTLRAIPDEAVVRGERVISTDFENRINAYLAWLPTFYQPVRNLSSTSAGIQSITDTGLVTTTESVNLNPNDFVRILRTLSPQNRKPIQGGRFEIVTATAGRTFQLFGWNKGATVLGRIRKDEPAINNYVPANMSISEVSTREVGKPTFSYRGRRTRALRQTA